MPAGVDTQITVPFKYRPLDPDEGQIRLLRIERSVGEAQPIRVTIKHVAFNDELEYIALSYTWGPESPTHNIHISEDGVAEGAFSIRQNLYDFFREMQKVGSASWFWIDQICINQDDQHEKSQQICRMSDLYSKAQNVLIWLGASFEGSDDLMDFINTANGSEFHVWDRVEAYILQSLRSEDDESTRDTRGDGIDKFDSYRHDLDATMTHFWSRDKDKTRRIAYQKRVEEFRTKFGQTCQHLVGLNYFKRVWIIQEITLGSDRIVRIGSKSASWENVTTFLDYMRNPDHKAFNSLSSWNIKRVTDLGLIWESGLGSETESEEEHQERGWYSVLTFVLTSQCTDMRDKAFSMLSLLPERLHIYPNYELEGYEVVYALMRKQITDRLARLDRNYSKTSDTEAHLGLRLCKESTMMNVVEAMMAAVATSVWYYEMHRGDQQGYKPRRVRSFILNEVFPLYREQRLAHGSKWGSHIWAEKIVTRILAPRENGLCFWFYHHMFSALFKMK